MEGIRRVLLADTGEGFRDGFAAAVENEPDIQIVGQTGDGAELLRLNSMQGGKSLYGQIEKVWGETGRSYLNKALADLCGTKSDHEVFDRLCSTLRGNAAAAVLTGNLNVTLLQAASLPTAAAELGWGSTGKSVLQFVKNVSPSKLAEIEKLAYEHGDAMLPACGEAGGESWGAPKRAWWVRCTTAPGTETTP